MCHQTVGLAQGELESRGIVTASITLLPEITRKIAVPRALSLPYPLGFPLGAARAPELQRSILRRLLELTGRDDVPFIAEPFIAGRETAGPAAAAGRRRSTPAPPDPSPR